MNWEYEEEGSASADPVTDFRLIDDPGAQPRSGGPVWWSAIVDLRDVSIDTFASRVAADFDDAAMVIPSDYDAEERAEALDDQPVVIFATEGVISALNVAENDYGVDSVLLGSIFDPAELNGAPRSGPAQNQIVVPDDTVVMAVIDDGIAIGNDVFRSSLTETRVQMAYVMRKGAFGQPQVQGRMIEKDEIDQKLAKYTYCDLLDETAFYQDLGIIDFASGDFSPTALRLSHGTHVMSMAAGYRIADASNTRPIICAMLPPRVTQDVTGQDLRPSLALAMRVLTRYALRFQRESGGHPPVVFNFSYGNYAESHDGTNAIARLIERTLKRFPQQEKRLVLAAGNGNLERIHGRVEFSASHPENVTLRMMVQPDDRTASYVQMWLPYSAAWPPPNYARVRVTSPDGVTSPWVDARAGARVRFRNDQGAVMARLAYQFQRFPTSRGQFAFSMKPTASLAANAVLAPAGEWLFELERVDLAEDQAIDVWIQRDDTLPGFAPHGRQAYFNNACYQRFDAYGRPLAVDPPDTECPIRRAGTLSGFADGASPLVIGAFVQSTGRMSGYSAAGPITPTRGDPLANRKGPDAAARADDSLVRLGVVGAGSHSGAMIRQGGTSNAAPLAARCVADGMAQTASGDRAWIWNQAQAQDVQFPPPPPIVTRGGGGRLNVRFQFEPKDPSV